MLNIVGHIVENARDMHVCGYYGDKILFQEKAGEKVVKRKLTEKQGVFSFKHNKKDYFINRSMVESHSLFN